MFVSRKRLEKIENRIAELENGSKELTFHYGVVDLKKLARIIDGNFRPGKRKTASGN